MKEIKNGVEVFGISKKNMEELKSTLKWHDIRKIFRDKYHWYAITKENDLIKIDVDDPKKYHFLHHSLYKDLRVIVVTKEEKGIFLKVNGRMEDIKALNLPFEIYEYDVDINITNEKRVQNEVNEILLKRIYNEEWYKVEIIFNVLKKFDPKVYGYTRDIFLYGKYGCSLNDSEVVITGPGSIIWIQENKIKEPKEENIELKIKKFLIK